MKQTVFRILACGLLVATAMLAAACGGPDHAGEDIQTTDTSEVSDVKTPETEAPKIHELNNYEGTLKYAVSSDGKTVNISYMANGELKSYTVPNNANYLTGGFAATDDLERSLPTSLTTGIYGENGERYVGIFYFLWHGEHGDSGVYDLQKIKDTYGELAKDANAKDPVTGKRLYGAIGQMHWFAEPLYGYYYASDEWVIRRHMELLANANVDFLYFDVTNGHIYKSNALKVMKVCHEMNGQGYDAPQVVFYTNSNSAGVMKQLYDEIYSKNLYSDTWFYVDGKPCIVGVEAGNINGFFTVKAAQWPNEAYKQNGWPWMDFEWPQRIFKDGQGNDSAISVSIAQHNRSVTFSDSSLYGYAFNRGRSFNLPSDDDASMKQYRAAYDADNSLTLQGLNFQAQWDKAIASGVPYVLVTGWNEWVAQRQDGALHRKDAGFVHFVDTASMEFSRDAEMMRGGYFDNYYMQLVSNIQRLKGSAPVIVQDARRRIDIAGDFAQWDEVVVKYTDPKNDCKNRNAQCFGNSRYTNFTGNNDIVAAKVIHDTEFVYFYVETDRAIHRPEGGGAWMQLFLNTDGDAKNGWQGYDYVANYTSESDSVTTLVKCSAGEGGRLVTEHVGRANYRVEDNKMMLALPMEYFGGDYQRIYLEFKWADADEGGQFVTVEDFYTTGDAAPLGRLNWIYRNYIAE